jgi:hypothetical protein
MPRLTDYSAEHQVQIKATLFARIVKEMGLNGGREHQALRTCLAAEDPRSASRDLLQKAFDNFGTKAATVGTSSNWGAPLSYATELSAAFISLVEAASLLGKIPGLPRVPPGLPIPVGTASGIAGWVGEAQPKPFNNLALSSLTVPPAKAVAMTALAKELLRSGPDADRLVKHDLVTKLALYIDQQFVDPAVAAVVGVNPASITHGTTGLVATGVPTTDIPVLVAEFLAARPSAAQPVLLVSPATAIALSLGKVDPGSSMPVVVSPALGALSIVADVAALARAGTDDIGVTVSEEALVQVSDAPDAPATAGTVYTSFFQDNVVGIRAEWFVSWARADVTAVKYSAPAGLLAAAEGPEAKAGGKRAR